MRGRCFESEIGSQPAPHQHNRSRRDVPRIRQKLNGRFCVLAPVLFARTRKLALAIAAIVECEHVHLRRVKKSYFIDRVADVSVRAMQINRSESTVRRGGNPPSVKLRLPRFSHREVNRVERQFEARWPLRDLCLWVIQQLPASLPEQEAE